MSPNITSGNFTQTTSKKKTQKQSSTDRSPQTPQNIPPHTALPIRGKQIHRLTLEHKHKSPLTRSQYKPLNQPFPPRAKAKRKKEYNPKACKRRPQVEQVRGKNEKTEKYSTKGDRTP